MGAGSIGIAECRGYCSELLDCYFELDNCAFVVVEIAVVGGREYGDDGGELLLSAPVIHFEAVCLSFMGSDDGKEAVFIEEALG